MNKIRLVIIGAGGHGSEVLEYVRCTQESSQDIELLGFVDDDKPLGSWFDSEVLGPVSILDDKKWVGAPLHYITAIGDNRQRAALVAQIEKKFSVPLRPWSLLHPRSYIGRSVAIGLGTCLAPGSVVTTNVAIGSHCIVNVNASISHDCELGNFININPDVTIAGNVRVGQGAFIGAGATVIDGVSIGPWAVVGAGAVVTRDVPPGTTVTGVPARAIKEVRAE